MLVTDLKLFCFVAPVIAAGSGDDDDNDDRSADDDDDDDDEDDVDADADADDDSDSDSDDVERLDVCWMRFLLLQVCLDGVSFSHV